MFIEDGTGSRQVSSEIEFANLRRKQLLTRIEIILTCFLLQHLQLLLSLLDELIIALQKILYEFGSIWYFLRLGLIPLLHHQPNITPMPLPIQVIKHVVASVACELFSFLRDFGFERAFFLLLKVLLFLHELDLLQFLLLTFLCTLRSLRILVPGSQYSVRILVDVWSKGKLVLFLLT